MIDADADLLRGNEAGIRCGWAVRILWPEELQRQSDSYARDNPGVRPPKKFFNDYKILPVYRADLKELNHPDRQGSGLVKRLYYISEDPNIQHIKLPPLWRLIDMPQGNQVSGGTSSMMMAPQETSLTAMETDADASLSSQVPAAEEAQIVQTSDDSAPVAEAPQPDTRETIEDDELRFNEVQALQEPNFSDPNVLGSFKSLLVEVGLEQSPEAADMFYKDFEVVLQTDIEAETRMQSETLAVNT